MADYNKLLNDVLADIAKTPAEKSGAKKFLAGLKTAMNVASALNVPFAGTARMFVALADAGVEGLDGKSSAINLDELFVQKTTDSLKAKGIQEGTIDEILRNKK